MPHRSAAQDNRRFQSYQGADTAGTNYSTQTEKNVEYVLGHEAFIENRGGLIARRVINRTLSPEILLQQENSVLFQTVANEVGCSAYQVVEATDTLISPPIE